MTTELIIYLIIINIIGFVLFGIDKKRAIENKYRIPEATLLGVAIIGGSIGSILGMRIFHHKTLHKKFSVGLPVILVLQIIALEYFRIL